MRCTYLIHIVGVLGVLELYLVAEAFISSSHTNSVASTSRIISRKKSRSSLTILFSEENTEERETKKIDRLADPGDTKDLPMFTLDYNADNVDYSQLPVPPFTSAFVFIVSTVFTIYLYYVGITGGVATAPYP